MLPVSPFTGNGSQTYVGMSKLPDSKWEKDVRLRQALSMLIDREAWLDAIQNVDGFRKEGLPVEVGINSHVPSTWAGVWLDPRGKDFGPNAKFLGYDPAAGSSVLNDPAKRAEYNSNEAAKLLRAANAFGAEDVLTFSQQGQFGNEKQLSIFVQMWNEGGHFKIKLTRLTTRRPSRQSTHSGTASTQTWGHTLWAAGWTGTYRCGIPSLQAAAMTTLATIRLHSRH
jgi:ABC-type transport system substrate-binding protein